MSKLNCPCGWQISNVCENEQIMYLISNRMWSELWEMDGHDFDPGKVRHKDLWKCQECGRIAIESGADEERSLKVEWYEPARPKPPKPSTPSDEILKGKA